MIQITANLTTNNVRGTTTLIQLAGTLKLYSHTAQYNKQ